LIRRSLLGRENLWLSRENDPTEGQLREGRKFFFALRIVG